MTDLISYSFNVTPMSFCNTIYINTHIDTHTGSQGKLFFFGKIHLTLMLLAHRCFRIMRAKKKRTNNHQ